VPKDLQLDGDRETFTVEVVYDTQVLYGVVKGQRQIVVYK
jgi:hypothetical protein